MQVPITFHRWAKVVANKIPYAEEYRQSVAWKTVRHRVALAIDERTNSGFTGFLRLPTQFEALAGPVVKFLTGTAMLPTVRIVVMGCSNGAEAYTAASVLTARWPHAELVVDAYDIDARALEKARTACYRADEVFNNKIITAKFVEDTFDVDGNVYRVKERIAARVKFFSANVLNSDLQSRVGKCDILFAQNFLFHLDRKAAARGFNNLCSLLNPRAAFFIDGMDIDLRRKGVMKHHLLPLDFRIEEIHNEARRARAAGWPYRYWGLEPFMTFTKDWQRRYATIYLKSGDRAS